VNREHQPPLSGPPGARTNDLQLAALQEIIRLAEDDRGRGIRYWFDPDLTSALRERVREVSGEPASPRPMATPPRRAEARPAVPLPSPAGPAPVSAVMPGLALPAVDGELPGITPVDILEPARATEARRTTARPVWGPPPVAVGRAESWREDLAALGAEAAACTACGLCATRRNVVFGTGSGVVPLVFVGEAPGHDEDLTGEPFVGRAGQLLTKIIEAIGLTREQVYICNVLKCRPPENRNPLPEEIAFCRHFLESQLELLKPKVICTLGLFAAQLLLGSAMPIGKLRGRLNTEGRWPILPTFHPAYLLRNPSAKATVWEDVQLVRRILDT
jgi:uracil-DNA glycosylase